MVSGLVTLSHLCFHWNLKKDGLFEGRGKDAKEGGCQCSLCERGKNAKKKREWSVLGEVIDSVSQVLLGFFVDRNRDCNKDLQRHSIRDRKMDSSPYWIRGNGRVPVLFVGARERC